MRTLSYLFMVVVVSLMFEPKIVDAQESSCAALHGASYELCNAYCETMDCDGPEPAASLTACESVADNYRMNSGGENPPCDVVCPCDWTTYAEYLIYTDGYESAVCDENVLRDQVFHVIDDHRMIYGAVAIVVNEWTYEFRSCMARVYANSHYERHDDLDTATVRRCATELAKIIVNVRGLDCEVPDFEPPITP